ncbi:helix-turn-helix transcriptional regulator [Candidatus Dojkabacteria bacterium]|nr:helix-turn-helix transcriptional regulator [Candidatus Dojkabacteria bacterium]
MTDKEIGLQIRKARKDAGLKQLDVAKKLGVTWEMISRYENGRSSARENLEKIAKVTKKPMGYFYGQTGLGSNNIDKLVEELRKRGVGYLPGQDQTNKVPFLEEISELELCESIKLTRQFYSCPEWILQKYHNIFALKLAGLISAFLEINPKDTGFFTQALEPIVNYLVLVKDESKYKIMRFNEGIKLPVLAVLLAVEKRFVY